MVRKALPVVSRSNMNRATAANFVVDIIAFAAFVLLVATGLVERYVLPPGTGRFESIWGMNRHQWGEIHFWIAVVLTGILTFHIVLHWKWISCALRGRKTDSSAGRLALGCVGLCGLVGLSLSPFFATVEQTGEAGRRKQVANQQAVTGDAVHGSSSSQIRGSMTMADIEESTGVPAAVLIRELGLPPDVPRDETMGRLRRRFGFEIHDIRRIVENESPSP